MFDKRNKGKDTNKSLMKMIFGFFVTSQIISFVCIFMAVILLITTVSSYYYISHKDKVPIEEDNKAKVKDGSACTCSCGCKGDPSKCTCSSGGSGSSSISSSTLNSGGGSLEFTGTLDKNNLVNQIFFLNKDITTQLGVPIWVPYAITSVETGGSIYKEGEMKIRQGSKALDSVTMSNHNGRGSGGAAGWFQIVSNSIDKEMGFISKDLSKYQSMLDASGINVNNYPGISSSLKAEVSKGYTQWYWDCEYYPSSIINFCLISNIRKDEAISKWLSKQTQYEGFNEQQKTIAAYFGSFGAHFIGEAVFKDCNDNKFFFNYVNAFVDVLTNKYDEFTSQKFSKHSGGMDSDIVPWVTQNCNVLTDDEKSEILDKFKTFSSKYSSGGANRFKTFTSYGTNAIYNAVSKNAGDESALNYLEKAGITINSGWFNGNGNSASNLIADNSQSNSNQSSQPSQNNGNNSSQPGKSGNNSENSNSESLSANNSSNIATNKGTNKDTSVNVGSTGSTGIGQSSSNRLGKLVSQDGNVPVYDGFTMNGDKYGYFDRSYKQFWDGSNLEIPALKGLGDFTLSESLRGTVYEGTGDSVKGLFETSYIKGKYDNADHKNAMLVDGRVAMAVPAAMVLEDANFAKYQEFCQNPDNYAPRKIVAPPFLKTKFESQSGFTSENTLGRYIDIVLDNGTVIPAIVTSGKGSHLGSHPNSSYSSKYSYDVEGRGWVQLTYENKGSGSAPVKGDKIHSFMLFEPWWGSTALNNALKGHKVVGTRTYKNIQFSKSNGYKEEFISGGTDSSFGLTGGSSTGTASIDGNSIVAGNGNNDSVGNNNCNCTAGCSCGCACSKGGGNGDISTTVGNVRIGLSATPGLPQGLYCDTSGKQLTAEEVVALYSSSAPNLYNSLKDYLGIAPTISTPEYWNGVPDGFKDKFGDGVGVVHYCQFEPEPYWDKKYVYRSTSDDTIVTNANFRSSSCGFSDLSIITSTMLHKYISPPEIILTSFIAPKISTSPSKDKRVFSGNVLLSPNADTILDCFKFKGKPLFNVQTGGGLNQNRVDEVLNAGGVVQFVTSSSIWTGGGHYVIIRHKDSEGNYYTVDSGNWAHGTHSGKPDRKTTFGELTAGIKSGQEVYVSPGEGYADYLEYYKTTTSSGLSADTGDNSNGGDNNSSGSGNSLGNNNLVNMLDSGVSPIGKQVLERDIKNVQESGGLNDITAEAVKYVGVKYVWGGNSLENGVDCSGFVREVYKKFGVNLPRTSSEQAKAGRAVSESELKPGDLLFYGDGKSVSHVVMYMGNGKIVHASSSKAYTDGGGVKTGSDIHYRQILAIRRFID